MALYYDCPELEAYDFSQLFIDERYQGRGYGKAAAKLILERMEQERKFDKVILCYMYESLVFYHTGEVYEDEIIMEMKFSA